MRSRRILAGLAIAITLVAGCSKAATTQQQAAAPSVLKWTGTALEGATFYQRRLPNLVIHYAPMTTPEQAERIAQVAQFGLKQMRDLGKCCANETVNIWVVPVTYKWPDGVPVPMSGYRALGGGHVLAVTGTDNATEPLLTAIMLSRQLPVGHPALASDWIHLGHGQLLTTQLDRLPPGAWYSWSNSPDLLERLKGRGDYEYYRAAVNLTALLADRYGINWPLLYDGEWTPEALLLWATDAPDLQEAFSRWSQRVVYIRSAHRTNYMGKYWVTTAADISPLRMEPKLPQLPPGPGPEANRSPHRYLIDARYDPEAATVAGTVRLTWQNGEGIGVDRLYFNLWPNAQQFAYLNGSMTVGAVTADGQPVAFSAAGLDLEVRLPTVAPGGRAEISIDFVTRLPLTQQGYLLGQQGKQRFQLAYWYPQLAVLDDRGWQLTALPLTFGDPYAEHAEYTVRLDVPRGTQVAATGQVTGRDEQDDRWVYQFAPTPATHWTAHGGTNLVELVRQVGPVTVRVLHGDKERAASLLAEAERTLRLFAQLYGPYPYPELAVVSGAHTAMPGVIGLGYMDDSNNWNGPFYQVMAQQWFGVTVGNDQWGEPWLDEGFARYASRKAMRTFDRPQLLTDLNRVQILPPLKVNSSITSFLRYGGYTDMAQELAARVLEDLEAQVGTVTMNGLMRTWVERYRFKTATTADFLAHAEAVAGRPLGQFFADRGVDPGVREPYTPAQPPGKQTLP